MVQRSLTGFSIAIAVLLMIVGSTEAAKYNEVIEVGDKAPEWKSLPGTDGKTYSLSDLQDAKAVVVAFTCNNCPVAVAYEDRLIKLAKEYKDQGVAVVAINVNKGETLEQMKQRAEEKGFPFPYVYDESQQSARQYGATCTPHVFLLDRERDIAYMGAIDDKWQNAEEVTKPYLRNAIDAVLKGETPETTESRQHGCGIKWKS